MSDYRIAHRYAKSLLDLAVSQNQLETIHEDFVLFKTVCDENRDFVLMLKNPVIKHDKKRQVIQAIFGKIVDPLTFSFFDIICKKNRESNLIAIAVEFHNQYNIHKGIAAASVITAVHLSVSNRIELVKILKEISGKDKIELKEEINPQIIGGFIIKIGDRQIDDSVSGKLRSLRKQLHVTA